MIEKIESTSPKFRFRFTTLKDNSAILHNMANELGLQDDCVEAVLTIKKQEYEIDENKDKNLIYSYNNGILSSITDGSTDLTKQQFRKYIVIKDKNEDYYLLYNSLIDLDILETNESYDQYIFKISYSLKIKFDAVFDLIRMIEEKYLDKLYNYYLFESV